MPQNRINVCTILCEGYFALFCSYAMPGTQSILLRLCIDFLVGSVSLALLIFVGLSYHFLSITACILRYHQYRNFLLIVTTPTTTQRNSDQ